MRTPLRITFQNTPSSEAVRRLIEEQVEHLEHFFGRLVACEVHFKLPDGNRRSGGLYQVSVHLKIPGGVTVDVDRTPSLDARFADPQFAVSDAFRRARRRLKDRAHVMRNDIKVLHKRLERSLDRPD